MGLGGRKSINLEDVRKLDKEKILSAQFEIPLDSPAEHRDV